MNGIALVLLSVALSAAGQLLLRAGVAGPPADTTSTSGAAPTGLLLLLLRPYVVLGLVCWCASTLAWIGALTHGPLTRLYGIGALNYVLVPLLAHRCFGEPFTRTEIGGSLLIMAGVAFLLSAPAGVTGHAAP